MNGCEPLDRGFEKLGPSVWVQGPQGRYLDDLAAYRATMTD
jgi:hypothetical protein